MSPQDSPQSASYANPEIDTPEAPTYRDLGALGVKILGLYFIVTWIPQLLSFPLLQFVPPFPDYALLAIPAAGILGGLLLILFSGNIAGAMLGSRGQGLVTLSPPYRELQAIAFSIAGIVMLAGGIDKGVEQYVASRMQGYDVMNVNLSRFAPAGVQVVLGVLLFFQSRGLAGLWHRIRTVDRATRIEEPAHRGDEPRSS